MKSNSRSLIEEADAATAAGNLRHAEELLLKASEAASDDVFLLLRIAALQRATGRPEVALATVHRALTLAPLDFTALLLRASLLDAMKQDEAAEAWSHALAQRPDGDLPQHLHSVVKLGEERVRQWTAEREATMVAAMASPARTAAPRAVRPAVDGVNPPSPRAWYGARNQSGGNNHSNPGGNLVAVINRRSRCPPMKMK